MRVQAGGFFPPFLKGNAIKIKSSYSPDLTSEIFASFFSKTKIRIKSTDRFSSKHLNLTFSKLITGKALPDIHKLRSH